uniref:DUF234 domain-containing protein n=1 Tax=Ignisphaera aggregans TaxID=334771 RepID=A0A7C4NPQ0_9CREN
MSRKFYKYVSQIFEDIAAKFALHMLYSRRINYEIAGKYIYKNVEIDFIAVDNKSKEK